MNRRLVACLFVMIPFVLGVEPAGAESPTPLTIQDCFEAALTHYEGVPIQEAEIDAAEGRYYQALGGALPHLTVKGSEFLQDTSGVSGGDSGIGQTFVRQSRPEVAINLKQPLFQGLREFRSLSGAIADRRKSKLETERARQLLYVEVARGFLAVKQLEADLQIVTSQAGVMRERVQELKKRIQLGKSRESEILATEAELAAVEAEVEEARGKLAVAREMLAFLTGIDVRELQDPQGRLAEPADLVASLEPLPVYLTRASGRFDVLASQENAKLSKAKLEYYKGGHLPQLNLEGNYYPYRVGFQQEIDWDLMLTLDIPIFQGGKTRGEVREAKARFRQAELEQSEAGRQAELEIRNAYHELVASRGREQALVRSTQKSKATYEAYAREYRLGLVDNLDLLQAARQWKTARRGENVARQQRRLNEIVFRGALGEFPPPLGELPPPNSKAPETAR